MCCRPVWSASCSCSSSRVRHIVSSPVTRQPSVTSSSTQTMWLWRPSAPTQRTDSLQPLTPPPYQPASYDCCRPRARPTSEYGKLTPGIKRGPVHWGEPISSSRRKMKIKYYNAARELPENYCRSPNVATKSTITAMLFSLTIIQMKLPVQIPAVITYLHVARKWRNSMTYIIIIENLNKDLLCI